MGIHRCLALLACGSRLGVNDDWEHVTGGLVLPLYFSAHCSTVCGLFEKSILMDFVPKERAELTGLEQDLVGRKCCARRVDCDRVNYGWSFLTADSGDCCVHVVSSAGNSAHGAQGF